MLMMKERRRLPTIEVGSRFDRADAIRECGAG